jgi:hypothetical protein
MGTPALLQGDWLITIDYVQGRGTQKFTLRQNGEEVTGIQHGELYNGTLTGKVRGNAVEFRSLLAVPANEHAWTFKGAHQAGRMAGTVNMGEYGDANWTAVRA